MPITDWPSAKRPRERLFWRGPQNLSDAELLAILLRTGVRGKTALDLDRDLLIAFGGLRVLLKAIFKTFLKHNGLGKTIYAQLQAATEMGRRHLF